MLINFFKLFFIFALYAQCTSFLKKFTEKKIEINECHKKHTKTVGGKLNVLENISDINGCALFCSRSPECIASNYNDLYKKCELIASFISQEDFLDWTSLVKNCSNSLDTYSSSTPRGVTECQINNYKLSGSRIDGLYSMPTLDECVLKCYEHGPECTGSNYYSGVICELLSGLLYLEGHEGCRAVKQSCLDWPHTTPPPDVTEECQMKDYKLTGTVIETGGGVENIDRCALRCYILGPECTGTNYYFSENGKCELLSGLLYPMDHEGCTAIKHSCLDWPHTTTTTIWLHPCHLSGRRLRGDELTPAYNVFSAHVCAIKCYEYGPTCVGSNFFHYEVKSNQYEVNCVLMSYVLDDIAEESTTGVLQSCLDWPHTTTTTSLLNECHLSGRRLIGDELTARYNVFSVDLCAIKCYEYGPACVGSNFFHFELKSNQLAANCVFMSYVLEDIADQRTTGVLQSCLDWPTAAPPDIIEECQIKDHKLSGNIIDTVYRIDTIDDCLLKCYEHGQECTGTNYYFSENGKCELLSGLLYLHGQEGCTAFRRTCLSSTSTSTSDLTECHSEDYKLNGNIIRTHYLIQNIDSCFLKCYEYGPVCTGSNFYTSLGKCELVSGSLLPEYYKGCTSVLRGCFHWQYTTTTTAGLTNDCHLKDFKFTGDVIDTEYGFERIDECAAKCHRYGPECKASNHYGTEGGKCEILSDALYNQFHLGCTAVLQSCLDWPTTTTTPGLTGECQIKDYKLTGDIIEPEYGVESINHCAIKCQQYGSECTGSNYYISEGKKCEILSGLLFIDEYEGCTAIKHSCLGWPTTTTTPDLTGECQIKDYRLTGDIIEPKLGVDSINHCAIICYQYGPECTGSNYYFSERQKCEILSGLLFLDEYEGCTAVKQSCLDWPYTTPPDITQECQMKGYTLLGNVIPSQYNNQTIDRCALICHSKGPQCTGFNSYISEGEKGRCELLSGLLYLADLKGCTAVKHSCLDWPHTTTTTSLLNECHLSGRRLIGDELTAWYNVFSVDLCAIKCYEYGPACVGSNFFHFELKSNQFAPNCVFMSYVLEDIADQRTTGVLQSCLDWPTAAPPDMIEECQVKDHKLSGNIIDTVYRIDTIDDCVLKCYEHGPECTGTNYYISGEKCQLLSGLLYLEGRAGWTAIKLSCLVTTF